MITIFGSVVKIENIEENKFHFSEVDILDSIPVLGIQPYIKYFDIKGNILFDWLYKHFRIV